MLSETRSAKPAYTHVMARRSSVAKQRETQYETGRHSMRRTSTGGKAVTRPMGRPTALTPRVEETILGYLMEGLPQNTACSLAGVPEGTFYRWMQRGEDARETLDATGSLPETEERFRDFRESVLDARAQAEHRAVAIINKAMHGGFVTSEEPVFDLNGEVLRDYDGHIVYKRTMTPPDGRLALQVLQRTRPKDWSQAAANVNVKAEVSGPGGGPIEVEHSIEVVANLSDRLMQVRQMFEAEEAAGALEAGDGEVVDGEVVEG